MLFMVYCTDKPGHGEVRLANRAAHLAYLKSLGDRILLAGPLLSDDGTGMVGSLLVVECADRAAAEAFRDGDPYGAAGLFQSVAIHPFRQVIPSPAAA
ncbi:MAG: hypothetical protein GC191_15755 [Azospirillum sp.]|nr:hypothetical protein [Azospirillum sp.]